MPATASHAQCRYDSAWRHRMSGPIPRAARNWPPRSIASFSANRCNRCGRPAPRARLLWDDRPRPAVEFPLTAADLDAAHGAAMPLPWTPSAKEALEAILKELVREGVRPGDRRQVKTVAAVRAFTWLAGASEVRPEHLEVAQHTLWDVPEEQPRKVREVIARVANPAGMRVAQLLVEADEIVSAVNSRDLTDSAKAAAKLSEVEKQFAALDGDPRADKARRYVREQLKQLKLASLDAV